MNIHKFGGSVLQDAACFARCGQVVAQQGGWAVLSAVAGVTATLEQLIQDFVAGQGEVAVLDALIERHHRIINVLLPDDDAGLCRALLADRDQLISHLHSIACVADCSTRQRAMILSYGEQWSARIFAAYLSRSIETVYVHSPEIICINESSGQVNWPVSQQRFEQFMEQVEASCCVCTGFLASCESGHLVLLGSNSGDYSAAIIAVLSHASCCLLWKDTPGLLSANPKLVSDAVVINSISYEAASEMAYFGSSVVHPKSITLLKHHGIKLIIRSIHHPDCDGTTIHAQGSSTIRGIDGVTYNDSVTLFNVVGRSASTVTDLCVRVFSCCAKLDIELLFIAQASSEHSVCFGIHSVDTSRCYQYLFAELSAVTNNELITRIDYRSDVSMVSIIGSQMSGRVGCAEQIFGMVAKTGTNVLAISQGSSERNISLIIPREALERVVNAIHAAFFQSERVFAIFCVGYGRVGQAVCRQLAAQQARIQARYRCILRLQLLANSKRMVDQVSFEDVHEINCDRDGVAWGLNDLLHHPKKHSHAENVVLDCSSSQRVAAHYISLMEHGYHIITPNKQAGASAGDQYQRIQAAAKNMHRHFKYETTVAAGLPVLGTIRDLVDSGDVITQIDAVLSGSLSYLFNQMALGVSPAQALIQAIDSGYCEPDPRDDLSGSDVHRKSVILARELAWLVDEGAVTTESLIPPSWHSCSIDEILADPSALDARLDAQRAACVGQQHLAYVTRIRPRDSIVNAVVSIAADDPMYGLSACDNRIVIYSQRYADRPMVIQGPGAGIEVTAAGIIADLLHMIGSTV